MRSNANILFELGKGVTPLMSPAEVQDQQMKREMNGLQLNALRQAAQDDTAYRGVLRSVASPEMIPNKLFQAGLGAQGQQWQKFQSEQQKTQAETRKAEIDRHARQFELAGQIMNGVKDQASWERAIQQTAQVFGPETAAQMPAQYDPALIEENRAKAMTVKDQLEQARKRFEFENPSANSILQAKTLRENNAATVGASRDRLHYDQSQPKGQVVQTADGPVIVDTRAGTSRPVMDATGNPARRPGKDIPANVNKSIIENQQNISKIEQAIAQISARPGALGPVNMIPGAETVRQFTDPEGVIARAGVADIGSLILHDRSGAAVTASETPRLRPFIPSASDRPEEAKKKLQRFKEIYEEEAGLLAQTYSQDQGYKESPVLKGKPGKRQAAPGTIAPPAAAIAFLKANPGMRAQFEAKYGTSADAYLGK